MIDENLINSAVSLQSYNESGQVAARQKDIINVMWRKPPMNQRTIALEVQGLTGHEGISDRSIQPRVSEMERMELVRRCGSVLTPETNKSAQTYVLTYQRPIMSASEAQKMGSRKNLRAENEELLAENEELKAENQRLEEENRKLREAAQPTGQLDFL